MGARLNWGTEKLRICLLVPPYDNYISAPGSEFHHVSPFMCFTVLGSLLEESGYDVEILDSRTEDRTEDEMADYIAGNFDICGVTTWLGSYSYLKRIVPKIKGKRGGCLIAAGGPLFSSVPRLLFHSIPFDIGVIGEGEYPFLEIVKNLSLGVHSYESIPGTVSRDASKIPLTSEPCENENLDRLPLPALHLWPSVRLQKTDTVFYETSRGCPFACSFCSHTRQSVSQKSARKFEEEMRHLVEKYQISQVCLVDSCFNLSPKRIGEISRVLGDFEISWQCMLRVDGIDSVSLSQMRRSGCERVWFGVESLSQKVLQNANKWTTRDDIERAVTLACDEGLEVVCWFILGLLGETQSSLDEMVEFSNKHSIVPRPNYLIPLPNTPYWQMAVDRYFSGDELRFLEWLSANGHGRHLLNLTTIPDRKLHEVYQALYRIMEERGQPWRKVK